MPRENTHRTLEVYYEKVATCPLRDRQYNFFELVYVLSGRGYYAINDNRVAFSVGDLFLITPKDCHDFDLKGICEFMVIRFSERYIREYQWNSMDHIECLLYHASHLSGSVIVNTEDEHMVNALMQNLHQATAYEPIYREDLVRHLVNAILVIAAKNIAIIKPKGINPQADIRMLQILDYIQEHIRQPNLLKIATIAEKFGLSPTYLGSYFRRQSNESIQQYISSYKIRLIEYRLRFSDRRIHEIADEFGFADESHINKFFKRHQGVSLKKYRNRLSVVPPVEAVLSLKTSSG
ncbi:AraC family transcriptional regulator [Sphingobacterium tabacisoli]|uniref:AraC family transcriptional regulator n=1 Tax=Sphingobacterium tabacisoli TaxID=2044855 RepID=A0ABW5L700_9SPHI|nr:AraC family transcriptional regulator [Sphingobacterium tabacisoli]